MSNEHTNGDENEVVVGTIDEGLSASLALGAVDKASIDIQIATAKRYPRSVDKSLGEAKALATLDEETAASMFYVLPRGGKKIEGPSARLAEIMAYTWGNLRVDADIVGEDQTHITAMGTCFDLEKNVAVRVRVRRRITKRNGKRFDDDMIGVTGNAAISIAVRNSVFKVIPAALVRGIYAEARMASIGKGGTLTQKRQNAIDWFTKVSVTEEQIIEVLGVFGLNDIGEEELITLRGLRTAIKDGETTVEQTFNPPKKSVGAEDLNEALDEEPESQKESETVDKETGEISEDDDGSPATEAESEKLDGLVLKAQEADILPYEEMEGLQVAIADGDGPAVRKGIKDLQLRLLHLEN